MSEYLATALVRVRPDTSKFREQLRADLKRATNVGTPKIAVKPEIKAFRQELQRELRRNPLLVPVRPDMKGFREELLRRLKTSTRGVAVRVPVEVAGRAATEPRPRVTPGVDELGNINNVTAARKRQTDATKAQSAAEASEARSASQSSAASATLQRQVEKLNISIEREVTALSKVSAIKKRAQALTDLERRANILLADARALNNAQLIIQVEAQLASIAAQRLAIPATLAEAEAHVAAAAAAKAHASQLDFLSRGAGSAGLSMLGVRGATLAANKEFLIGAAAIAVFSKTVLSAAQLEQNLNVFAVTAGATADQLKRAADTARELGQDVTLPGVAADDAASAFTNLAKAGIDVENSLSAARGVLQLATAAEIENAEATELVASALNAFGLSGMEAVRVADLLTGAANESQGSITDMGIALQQSSAAARQAGLNVEDTVAILTLLARNGLRGSDAGTSLRTALLRLIRPTKNANDILKQLAVNVRDAQGNIRPEVFADLGIALEGASRKQRDFALATIFGADAFRSASILGRESTDGLNAIRTSTQQAGLAAELAGARTAGFTGQVEALKNNLSVLGTTIGGFVIGPAGDLVDSLTEIVGLTSDAADGFSALSGAIPGGGLFSDLFRFAPTGANALRNVAGAIEQTRAGLEQVRRGGLAFDVPTRGVRNMNKELLATFDTTEELVAILNEVQILPAGESTSGPKEALDAIQNLKDELIGSGEAARVAREQLDGVARLIVSLGRAPTRLELQVFLEKGFIDKTSLREAARELNRSMAAALKADSAGAFFLSAIKVPPGAFGPLATEIITGLQAEVDKAGPVNIKLTISQAQFEAQAAGFAAKGVRAELFGTVQGQLQLLDEEQAVLERQLSEAIGKGAKQRRTKIEARLLEIRNERQQILDAISSAADQRKRDADERKEKIRKAREDAHRATIAAFNLSVSQQQNRILLASATAWLADDLRANKELQRILKGIIASGKLTNEELNDFARQLIQAGQDRDKIKEDIRDRRREERERVLESLGLDVEIAAARGNRAAEIKARQAEINALKRAIAHEKAGSIERKRLQLELINKQKELKELKGAQGGVNDALKAFAFEFLQTQRGFAANLLGNLIPIGVSGGLVGNTSPTVGGGGGGGSGVGGNATVRRAAGPTPAVAVRQQSQSRDVTRAAGAGPTRSQATVQLELLRQIVRVLREIQSGRAHPEANRQRRQSSAVMDTDYGY